MNKLFVIAFCLLALAGKLSLTSRADPLSLGAKVTGQIDQPGQVDQYKASPGTPGQRLIYDALDTDAQSINARLIAPSGTVLFERNSRTDVEPFTLLESGIYTLAIDGNGSSIGGYTFRLTDLSAPPPLGLETPITKTLDPGAWADVYPFNGTAGQHLYFDGLGANSGAAWYLYAPNNLNLGGAGIGGDFAITLGQTGAYALIVWGSAPAPVPYSIRVVASTWTTNTMTLGSPITGTIAKPGDQQSYTFPGTVGQRLVFDALDTDPLQINARLVSPSGAVIFDRNSRSDVEPFTLTETGAYTLVVYGSGATVGGYKCRLMELSASPALPFDTVVSKTLDPGTSVELYPFTGAQGNHLYFHGLGSNSGGTWCLYSPNNQNLGGAGIGGDFEVTLGVAGTYVAVVYGSSPNPLPYSFQVVTVASPKVSLVLGTTVSGTIARPGDQALYTFAGAVGQRIYYDSLDRDFEQIYSRLISPSGALVWDFTNQSNDVGPVTLTEAGLYTVVIDGSIAATGDFQFRLLDLSQAQTLGLTGATTGQLNPASATEAYQINGTAGQRFNFKMVSTTSNQAGWRMVGPANQNLALANLPTDLGDVVLPVTGTYWLLVEGTSDSIAALSYQFAATDHTEPVVAVSGLGEVRTGTIAAGQQDTLSFNAPAGLWVYFDSQDRTSGNLIAELKDPTGVVVSGFNISAANDAGPYQLPRSGAYTLAIRGANASLTGTFRYRLIDCVNGAQPLTMNTIVTADLDPGYRTDIYQFSGQPGQRLVYDALDNDFSNVAVRLIAPDGQIKFVNGNSDTDVGPFTLNAPGTYYLIFESNLPTPASYKARLLDVASQPELSFGAPLNPSIDPGLGNVLYRVNAPAGQRLFFDGLSSAAQGSWYLFGPNNENFGGTGLNNDFEYVTVQPGLYVLYLVGNSTSPVATSFEAYKPAESANALQITSFNVTGSTATLVWSAAAGKVYRVQYVADLGPAAWADLAGDITATGASATKSDNTFGNASRRFYRVMVVQ